MTKTGAATAASTPAPSRQQKITAGDGFTQFTAGANGPLRIAGLTAVLRHLEPRHHRLGRSGSRATVADGPRRREPTRADTSFVAGDVFRVAVQSGVVRYSKNGTVFYTSQTAPAYPLVLAAALINLNWRW